jgi:hypothetical protein
LDGEAWRFTRARDALRTVSYGPETNRSDLQSGSLHSTSYLLLSSGDPQVRVVKFLHDGIEQIMHVPLPILSYATICYWYLKGVIYIVEIVGARHKRAVVDVYHWGGKGCVVIERLQRNKLLIATSLDLRHSPFVGMRARCLEDPDRAHETSLAAPGSLKLAIFTD